VAECILMVHGVAWSQDTPSLRSSLSAQAEKNPLSIPSMLRFFPLASPSCPNSSGP